MSFFQILTKRKGSILLADTPVTVSGNQWLAWRLSSVDDLPSPLESAIRSSAAGLARSKLTSICNEMFRTWPPLVLGWFWFAALLAGPCKSGNGKYARG